MMPIIGFLVRPDGLQMGFISITCVPVHLCALDSVKLPVPEVLLPWDAWMSLNLMYRDTQRLVR